MAVRINREDDKFVHLCIYCLSDERVMSVALYGRVHTSDVEQGITGLLFVCQECIDTTHQIDPVCISRSDRGH